ncbi:MAG TPA: sigma-70 family RNA polymerase sigma factor [Rhizomicrobium sp.]|nr:sigma-70 family RNA polymerase sigma factor [Rhizomicrobium sp.]
MSDTIVGRALWSDLVRQIAARTRNYDDAEDLLHTAYLKLVRYQAQTPVENIPAFLVRTAINANIDNCRHTKALKNVAITPQLEDSAPLQDEVVGARIRLGRTKAGLDRLPARTREIVLMHKLDGLKYNEIASRIGISASAVEKHMAKALLFLAQWTEGW